MPETPWYENFDLVTDLTKVIRKADAEFEKAGGSSRHWMRDHFLPGLDQAGFKVVKKET